MTTHRFRQGDTCPNCQAHGLYQCEMACGALHCESCTALVSPELVDYDPALTPMPSYDPQERLGYLAAEHGVPMGALLGFAEMPAVCVVPGCGVIELIPLHVSLADEVILCEECLRPTLKTAEELLEELETSSAAEGEG